MSLVKMKKVFAGYYRYRGRMPDGKVLEAELDNESGRWYLQLNIYGTDGSVSYDDGFRWETKREAVEYITAAIERGMYYDLSLDNWFIND